MTLAQPYFCIMLSSTQDWLQPALHHNIIHLSMHVQQNLVSHLSMLQKES